MKPGPRHCVLIITMGCLSAAAGADEWPLPETPEQRDSRMAWWRDARFGLFIHWGLYAIPAGEWRGATHHGEWIMHTGQIPVEEYTQFVGRFNPVKFDADAWVKLAKDAGMKYIVITTKHHDGFCLFDSKQTDYDIMSSPFRRDIMKELAEACRKGGIRLGWYHSIMDWHHPDYLPRRDWEARPATSADYSKYRAYLKAQVGELLRNYGDVAVMWFDGEWEGTWTHEQGIDLYNYVRQLQPATIVNNRVDKGRGDMIGLAAAGFGGDYGTPEQEVPANGWPGVDWETCMTMNDHWGFNKADQDWKSTEELIHLLVDISSKGGNFLLNVGPTAEGLIPQPSVERMAAMGAWLRLNGESVYGTQASPLAALPWGRCTQRRLESGDGRLYLHVFERPADGRLVVPGLLSEPRGARLLAAEKSAPLKAERREDAVVVTLPDKLPDAVDSVVVLDLVGPADVADPPVIKPVSDIFIDSLEVAISTPRRHVELRYTTDGSEPNTKSPVVTGPITLKSSATVRARSFRDGKPVSPTAEARVRKVAPRPAETAKFEPGLRFEYFEGEWQALPDFRSLKAAKRGTIATFDISARIRDEKYGFRYTGFVEVPTTGVYSFSISSDDGSRLYIGDQLVVDNDGLHEIHEESGHVALAAGRHAIRVDYFERTGGDGLVVLMEGPGVTKQPIPASRLFHAFDSERPHGD